MDGCEQITRFRRLALVSPVICKAGGVTLFPQFRTMSPRNLKTLLKIRLDRASASFSNLKLKFAPQTAELGWQHAASR